VDAHHVKHWANGGETSLENLLLLCTRHHRAVHEGGYSIRKDFQDCWRFFRPDGIAVPQCGYVAGATQCPKVDISLTSVIRSIENPSARGISSKRKNGQDDDVPKVGGVESPG
jgi:hypothetical protein